MALQRTNPAASFLLLLAAAMFLLLLLFQAQTGPLHADLKHGHRAEIARECRQKPLMIWLNPVTGRQAYICLTSSGKWGIWIEERGREVTAFLKEKMRSLEQVVRYIKNAGYTICISGCP